MQPPTSVIERAAVFLSAFAIVASLQAAYGWWLNSGRGVLRTTLVLLVWSMVVALRRGGRHWERALALWLGAISALAGVLFWIGPGTIWPIALAAASVMTAGAVLAGTAIGRWMSTLGRGR